MMEKIIKEHIWAMAKADGTLVSRTSYGVQYHALMLVGPSLVDICGGKAHEKLRQGTKKGPK
jgi:hypothetical protein